jgi:CHAD domain-containing protein
MPAPHAVRVIASDLLGMVLAAQARFEKDEPDALHDLRVAMRRLRTWLRAFRPELSDTLKGRTRRRLRTLAAATGQARDAEVMLAFIGRQGRLRARARPAVHAVAEQFERERDDHLRGLRRTVARDVDKASRELARQLGHYWVRHRVDEPSTQRPMAEVFVAAIHDLAQELESELGRIEPSGKADHVHRARIAAKRLRYLLEPLDEGWSAEEPIQRLQALQQQLGDARDAHRIAMRFIREVGESAARAARSRALTSAGIVPADDAAPGGRVSDRSGLAELARRAHRARETAFAAFASHWGEDGVARLLEQVDAVAARVSAG